MDTYEKLREFFLLPIKFVTFKPHYFWSGEQKKLFCKILFIKIKKNTNMRMTVESYGSKLRICVAGYKI